MISVRPQQRLCRLRGTGGVRFRNMAVRERVRCGWDGGWGLTERCATTGLRGCECAGQTTAFVEETSCEGPTTSVPGTAQHSAGKESAQWLGTVIRVGRRKTWRRRRLSSPCPPGPRSAYPFAIQRDVSCSDSYFVYIFFGDVMRSLWTPVPPPPKFTWWHSTGPPPATHTSAGHSRRRPHDQPHTK